nr:hypothetical protein [Tanacetum cinerariifolium]
LYTSFITLLKNFDREDLEDLWKIMKAKFSTSKPTNFTDDYLLVTLKNMFEKTDAQDVIWRSQQTEHGQALVKSWKLLTSCDVVDSGPIFDTEPEQKVQNDDHYDVFVIDCQHHEQSESVHDTHLIEQDAHNVLIESVDTNSNSEQIDQNDEDADLAKE